MLGPRTLVLPLTLALFAGSARAQCGDPLSIPRGELAVASHGNLVIFAGGRTDPPTGTSATSRIDVYDSATGTWSTDELSVPRAWVAAAAAGGRVLFAGGSNNGPQGSESYAVVDLLEVATGTWTTGQLSQSRLGAASATLGTRAFFAGGWSLGPGPVQTSDVVDVYDDATGTWNTATLSQPRAWIGGASVGQKVLFAGGMLQQANQRASDVVDVYDDATGTWSTATLSEPRFYVSAATVGSKVYFAGGQVTDSELSSAIDVYDDATGLWSTLELPTARRCGAVALGDLVLFSNAIWLYPTGLDVYDTVTGLWWPASFPPGRNGLPGTRAGSTAFFADFELVFQFTEATIPTPYCFGAGGACPCGNAGTRGAGCGNSAGNGAILFLIGGECSAVDDVQLTCEGLVPGELAVPFVGLNEVAGGAGTPFGDGLRCAGGSLVRLPGASTSADGRAFFGPGLAALGGWGPGDLRRFQVWYRDPAGPCGAGFNTTNGVRMTFGL